LAVIGAIIPIYGANKDRLAKGRRFGRDSFAQGSIS
jgi:hypothetical protein